MVAQGKVEQVEQVEQVVRARGWGEAHRVRVTPALLLCSLPDLFLWNVQGTFS